jgi:5-methylcytosine-specific restriction endonuclease McrA
VPFADPKRRAAHNKAWRAAHRFEVLTSYRAKQWRREYGGDLTTADLRFALSSPCAYCGGPSEVLEHVTPLSRGGRNDGSNVVGACQDCNDLKATQTALEFLGLWPQSPSADLTPCPF